MQAAIRRIPIPVFALLLVAISIGLGELGARLQGDEFPRWFSPMFGVAFAVWTYVFYFDGHYRIADRQRRLIMFVALSAIGFALTFLFFPVPEGAGYRATVALILSVPSLVELMLGRPVFRKPPP